MFETAVTEHSLHMMDRSASLEQSTCGFVAEIVKVKIDRGERRA